MTKTTLTESQKRLEKAMATLEQQTKVTLEQQVSQGIEQALQPTALSVKELQGLGHEVANIMNRIELINYGMDAITMTSQLDQAIFAFKAKEFLEKCYEQNQTLIRELDRIAYLLMENNNQEEIQAFR